MRKIKSRPPHFNPVDYIFFLRRHVIMGRNKYEIDDIKEQINVPPLFDLLKKLKDDFNYSFISFQDEFIHQNGISSLIDVLRICQNRQSLPENQSRPQHLKKFLFGNFTRANEIGNS
ncbi:uncharacterized protein LOC111623034 [Centruroides sculpturatus]|uniref:uncharacterized protein LOC111623034 n=1 Tax=Centruroides sculpturatus TaxID=218467 RepID=UPI000C6E115A|nr:uncharacterized protein LOC111623034 [Centruroides sculpturatus]